MRLRSAGVTSLLPVASAMALLAFCLVGARLYASSAGSAAIDRQLDETCASASAIDLPVPRPNEEAVVDEMAAELVHVSAPRQAEVGTAWLPLGNGADRPLPVLHIDGVEQALTPPLEPLGKGEIALSRTNVVELATELGGTITTASGQRLVVAQVFDDVPISPIPDYWCGWAELFEPTAGGDAPAPSAIASSETIASLGAYVYREYRVADERLTMTEARATLRSFEQATEAWNDEFGSVFGDLPPKELPRVLARAEALTDAVQRTLAPVLLTAVVAVGVVLVAAAVMLARARRRELRLLAVRGLPPWRIAATVAPGLAAALAAGSIVGAALASGAVRAFGPSPRIEPAAWTRGAVVLVAGLAVAIPLVSVVVAIVADRSVDHARRRYASLLAMLLLLVGLGVLTVASFRRLDRDGGIRTFGVEARGGSLIALGFPLFALLAIVALAAVIVNGVVRPLRMTGAGLPRWLRLGWRRVVIEGPTLAAIVAAVALAAGCLTTASSLAEAARRQLAEKAEVYVGADLAITVYDEPTIAAAWDVPTSLVATARIRDDGTSIELMGIDTATFGGVARLRSDASDRTLDELIDAISSPGGGGPAPALAVGADAAVGDIVSVGLPGSSRQLELRITETLPFFPSASSGSVMYVADRRVVEEAIRFPVDVLFVRDAPADAVAQLQDAGVRTGLVRDVDAAFDGSAYSALRWAYAPLAVLGLLFAVVALALQLLVVSARTTARRATHTIMRRTSFGTRSLFAASVIETAIPLALGTVIGVAASVTAGSLGVGRLDPMPALQPPTLFEVPWTTVIAIAAALPVWTAAIAALITRTTVTADPLEVLHGEL